MTVQSNYPESRQSSWLDVAAFVLAFALGVSAYFGIRAVFGKDTQVAVTSILVIVMVTYAGAIVWVPRLRVRKDQAGDNSYYLGLLFTLSSMGFALYDFGVIRQGQTSAAGVQQIIANFGIALATTIGGIFLRVTLHQMRVDPADLEATTRVELTEAAMRLRAALDTITTDLSRFHLEIRQRSNDSATELAAATTKAVKQVVEGTAKAQQDTLKVTEGLTKHIAEAATETLTAVEKLRAVKPPALLLSTRLERAAGALEQVAAQSDRTSTALSTVIEAANRGAQTVTDTATKLNDLAGRMNTDHGEIVEKVRNATTGLSDALDGLGKRVGQVLGNLAEMDKQSKRSAEESLRAQEAAVRVLTEMTSLTRKLADALNSR
jgi:methyl-accepting chemotaxis protein